MAEQILHYFGSRRGTEIYQNLACATRAIRYFTALMLILSAEESDRQVVQELENFIRTGSVATIPLTGFDQTGKWIGMKQRVDSKNFPRKLTKKISRLKVPISALITIDAVGQKTLHGSYVVETETTVTIDFHTVLGDIIVRSTTNPDFHAPNLECVEGTFNVLSSNVDTPKLQIVLLFLCVTEATYLNAPALRIVGRCLVCLCIQEFSAPVLKQVGGDLLAPLATRFQAPLLESVGRHLIAGEATAFLAPNLRSVGEVLHTSSAENFYLPNLEIGGAWFMHPEAQKRFSEKHARRIMKDTPLLEI